MGIVVNQIIKDIVIIKGNQIIRIIVVIRINLAITFDFPFYVVAVDNLVMVVYSFMIIIGTIVPFVFLLFNVI